MWFLACFEAYLGRFDSLHVPETLRIEPFWDPKSVKHGPKKSFFDFALRKTGVLKHVLLALFVPVLGYSDTPYFPETVERARNAYKYATGTKDAVNGPGKNWE